MNKGIYFLSVLLCLAGCEKVIHKKPVERAESVRVEVVAPVTAVGHTRYVGTVEALRETPLSMQGAGRVVSVRCHDGEHVQAGQVLLCIDSTQAVNACRSAEASLRQAEDGYERVKQVYASGGVTEQQMVEVESKLAQAQSMVAMARRQVAECTLRSPSEGVVSGLEAETGQTVVPGVRVLSLLDMSGFAVSFAVPEAEVGSIGIGECGTMSCAATGRSYRVRVREKNLKANPIAHTYSVRADVEGATEGLMPGMVAKVVMANGRVANGECNGEWRMANGEGSIVVPAGCVHLLRSGASVWVVRGGRAERVPVEVDGYEANGVRIRTGLNVGDTIVVEGQQKLYQGCRVMHNS